MNLRKGEKLGKQHSQRSCKTYQISRLYDAKEMMQPATNTVKSKEGKLLTKEEVQKKWKKHFEEVLNRPAPDNLAEIPSNSKTIEKINTGPITREEVLSAIMYMEAEKASRIESITVELLKADTVTSVNVLLDLLGTVWDTKTVPDYWSKGLIVKIAKKEILR